MLAIQMYTKRVSFHYRFETFLFLLPDHVGKLYDYYVRVAW